MLLYGLPIAPHFHSEILLQNGIKFMAYGQDRAYNNIVICDIIAKGVD